MVRAALSTLLLQGVMADCGGGCCYPGVCVEPAAKSKEVFTTKPRQQWNVAGGFCGSLSIQVMVMGHGAWISEDLIRKANIGAPCAGHGDDKLGCEVGPENYAETAKGLRLRHDVWDFESQPKPQAKAFKAWMKSHLVKREPVMWAPMEQGSGHQPYGPDSTPGGGAFDHHEPIIGIGSQHDLSDPTVYDDDWLLHFSAQDLMPYYRNFSSLEDGLDMQGNCKDAGTGYPDREAYPCFYDQVAYGLSTQGFDLDVDTLEVNIDVDRQDEPNIRTPFTKATALHATVTVKGLQKGKNYILYRYEGINSFPSKDLEQGYKKKTPFTASDNSWVLQDPDSFQSDGATYYIAVPADEALQI